MPKTRINITLEKQIHELGLAQKDKRYMPTFSSYITYLIGKDQEELEQHQKQERQG